MAALHCPHCGASMPGGRSWSQAALSTLMQAPAVPDMSTQVRCTACGRISAAGDLRHTVAERYRTEWVVVAVVVAVLIAWLAV